MSSAIICLATNQKFNFSKYIFESMKHLDNGNKFLTYPRFVKIFLDKQVDGLSKHNAIYVVPSHTKKVFGNMKRVGKGFSGRDTPLFPIMLVPAQEEELDAEITLVDETTEDQGRFNDQEMFDTSVLDDDEVVKKEVLLKEAQDVQNVIEKVIEDITTAGIEETVSTVALITTVNVTPNELTMAQALMEIKKSKPKADKVVIEQEPEQGATTTTTVTIPTHDSTRPKARGVVMKEPSETPKTTTIQISLKEQEKGKGIMVEEPLKMKKKDQISFNEQEARRLQAEIDEQDRLTEEKAWKIEDENLAWDNKAFNKTMSWINSFMPMDSEVVKEKVEESSLKRVGDEQEQESAKKQKVDDDPEAAELKRCLEIVLDNEDDVTIDATPLSSKSPTIVDYKIHKEGRKNYFQIIREDGSSQMYYTFSKMLKNINREALEVLWSIVKDRFEKKTFNNDKSLSKIQLEHEKEDEFVVVMMKVVHELKEIVNRLLKEVEVCLFGKKFEQDIDDEEEEDEEGEGGSESTEEVKFAHHAHLELVMHDFGKIITHVLTSRTEYDVIDISLNDDDV
nr:hypothetical protein [Tanacetum cinerariifolium]